jgi:RNA polymerase sigma-70 factor, ECF subfamily
MTESIRHEITRLLGELGAADVDQPAARNRLFVVLYGELRRLAGDLMRHERRDHTLQPTALVNEAYLRLVDAPGAHWENRAHFFGIAASAMRQILVEHARRRSAAKRGGGGERVSLDEAMDSPGETPPVSDAEILDLDRALTALGQLDERAARIVELRVFAGLEMKEIAQMLGVSERTIHGDWRIARMWLARELGDGSAA